MTYRPTFERLEERCTPTPLGPPIFSATLGPRGRNLIQVFARDHTAVVRVSVRHGHHFKKVATIELPPSNAPILAAFVAAIESVWFPPSK